MPSRIVSNPDPRSQRLVRRSRIVSYVLAGLGVVALSFAPSVLGDPSGETARVLLHVVRPVVATVLIVAAFAVQVVVGVRWRKNLVRERDRD
ncbi:hypothetical protein [Curtobacterium sp. RRHDQ10]|uniref:hypothetical protein n=1 Tax=Curtobacterium phyllosphaerae TaxID=3413379 RepID=UPI003BF0881A